MHTSIPECPDIKNAIDCASLQSYKSSDRFWPNLAIVKNSQLSRYRSPATIKLAQTGLTNCSNAYLRNRKHVLCFYRVIQTRVEVWENEKCCGNTSHKQVFPQLFRVLPNFHEGSYNSKETRSTCFLFLLENTVMRKRKTTC